VIHNPEVGSSNLPPATSVKIVLSTQQLGDKQ